MSSGQSGGRTGGGRIDVLIAEADLRARVEALGREITRDYAGRSLVVVGVLKGSFVFLADLVRAIDLPVLVEFIGISSSRGPPPPAS
jgi:hypoxanthine phosphoribosyltransferase